MSCFANELISTVKCTHKHNSIRRHSLFSLLHFTYTIWIYDAVFSRSFAVLVCAFFFCLFIAVFGYFLSIYFSINFLKYTVHLFINVSFQRLLIISEKEKKWKKKTNFCSTKANDRRREKKAATLTARERHIHVYNKPKKNKTATARHSTNIYNSWCILRKNSFHTTIQMGEKKAKGTEK